jgi:3-deoxy-D-manno-octulosonic acid (KDO) 8-phosphate synthase
MKHNIKIIQQTRKETYVPILTDVHSSESSHVCSFPAVGSLVQQIRDHEKYLRWQ